MKRAKGKAQDMRNACRPVGRFFCLLMVMTAAMLPRPAQGQASGPAMTQVVDTLYRADGTVAAGMVMIAWPAFTTADGKAVAAGSLSVPLGSGGAFSASLAPNTGAQPAGVYYRVVYQLTGQEPSSEYWVVPATGSIGIGSVRAKLMPPTIAAQVLTRDVADSNYVHVTGNSTVTGVVGFTASPQVPTPQNPGDATNKGYVDAANANLLAAPAAIGSTTPNKGAFTTLTASGGISGNLNGNVAGNLTGNVSGNVTGNVTGNLNGSVGATTPSTGVFTQLNNKVIRIDTPANCPNWPTLTQACINNAFATGVSTYTNGFTLQSGSNKTYQINATTTDSDGCWGVLISGVKNVTVDFAGSTLNYNVKSNCRAYEVRNSTRVRTLDLNLTNSNALVGTAVSMRRPSNSEGGYTTQYNMFDHVTASGFNKGFEIGVSGEGQTDQSYFLYPLAYDCNYGYAVNGPATEAIMLYHATATAAPTNGIYFDLVSHSGTLVQPVTGSSGNTGVIHFLFDVGGLTWDIYDPSVEVSTSDSALAIKVAAGASPTANFHNGYINKFSSSSSVSFMDFAESGSSGVVTFDSVNFYCNTGQTCNVAMGGNSTRVKRQNESVPWTRVAVTGLNISNTYLYSGFDIAPGIDNDLTLFGNKSGANPFFQAVTNVGSTSVGFDFIGIGTGAVRTTNGFVAGTALANTISMSGSASGNTTISTAGTGNPGITVSVPGNPTSLLEGQWKIGYQAGSGGNDVFVKGSTPGNPVSIMAQPEGSDANVTLQLGGYGPSGLTEITKPLVLDNVTGATQCLHVDTTGKVTGTGSDCGSGGGSVNLASPPAIGSTTPNAGTFTTLTSQVVNGIPNAARFSGADACAKINVAIGSLDATVGGTVEARGFVASDLATACTTTLTIDRPVRLLLPEGVLLLGGNPGILITTYSSGVKLEGRGWEANYNPLAGKGTILRSTGPYPMIVDSGAQGTELLDVELDGHSTGTFGFLGAFAGGITFRHVHVHNFQYTGLIALGGINSYYDVWSNNNGGEGMLLASDVVLEGNMQVALNGGSGLHMISSGAHFKGTDSDHNGLHGIYIDGRHRGDWTAGTKIIQPMVIMPLSNNAGGYLYYSANVGGTTGATAPVWNQSPNAVFSDGTVTWVNIGNNVAARAMDAIAQLAWIEGGYVDDNGTATPSYPGFVADNIRVEGDPVVNFQNSCNWINITGTWVSQAAVRNATITGIHFLNCYESEVSGAVLLGSGYAGNTAPLTPDQGGLVVENSGMNTFSNITAHFQTRSAVQLINARENVFANLSLTYGAGNSSVPAPMNYAINIDANSSTNQFNMVNIDTGGNANSKGIYNRGSLTYVDNYQTVPGTTTALDDLQWATLTNAHGRTANVPVEFDVNGAPALSINSSGQTVVSGDLSVRDIPGHEYFVSKYASIQAAINAAYNNGTVQGGAMVIDDRTSPYSGPGFIVYDSVTLKLAATTYTITGTVSYNNGVNTVTAGIISVPGSHIVGSGTSANHGTNVNAGAGLNADVIATSTVGTGAGANAQWWHWGSIENFHMNGNKAQQTAGSCINVENMGETAVLRALEVGNCYSDDIRLEGNFATQSEISNITVNSAGQFGVDLDNFQGVGVLRGLSGDSNATSIIRFNGEQSATLTVLGLKSEEEISGHDPLITIDMPTDGSQPAFSLVGGYTYARPGVQNVIKIINGKSGVAPFVTVSNFYVDGNFVNAVNDTVNSRTFAAANMNKVPFSYLPTGSYQSGQAFTFAPGTFIQGGSSALTEIFGSNTDGSSMIAAQGNGDGTSYFTGGLKIGIPNRTQFGQPPEMMARMGSRFLGAGQGYDTNTWVFVPIWKSGDTSNRWLGDPNQRWPEVYAGDVNATTATVGTLNVTSCVGCGSTQVNSDWNASSGMAQILNKPTIPSASASTPAMNGVGAAGTSTSYARADHVHPSDTSRVATTTTVNGHPLSGNIAVTASDVGAMHMISGTMAGPSSGTVGNSNDQNMFSVTIPANTVAVGTGIHCYARWAKTSGSNAVTYKWTLGSTTFATQAVGASTSQNWVTDLEIFTPSSMSSEVITADPIIGGTTVQSGPQVGLTASEIMSNALTLKITFNATSSETVTPKTFYCTTVQ